MEKLKSLLFAGLVGYGACFMQAQKVSYPDYELLKDSATNRMLEFHREHKCLDINAVRMNLLDDLSPDNKVVTAHPLPKFRKKVLDARQLYALCRQSSLVFLTMEYRPQSKDYWCYTSASAVALSTDGLCVTNYHVLSNVILSGALQYRWKNDFMRFVMTAEGKVYPVKRILAADPVNDFVVFRVDMGGDELVPVPLGNPLEVGEKVYCISHPQGNLFYLTEGIVARNLSTTDKQNGQVRTEMQITADYGVGSSGGPIFDSKGNLAGMVSATYSLYANPQLSKNFQMAIKKTVPVKLIKACFETQKK